MKFDYKDILDHKPCCRHCDNRSEVEIDGIEMLYCPIQEQIVVESGFCGAYDGFWSNIGTKG